MEEFGARTANQTIGTLSRWRRSVVCPLLKMEPADRPQNWRAVALLSHARKIIEKSLDATLRANYRFHPSQCGFRKAHSMDTVIIRLLQAVRSGCIYICVLDLKQAYAFVPRGDLMARIYDVLPHNTASMIKAMLLPTLVSTVGDDTKLILEMRRGVPEGSPLSPSLFNVYIDRLAYEVEAVVSRRWINPMNLFADDVVLMAPSSAQMQALLSVCGNWAAVNGLEWGVAKCHALAAQGAL